MGGFTQTVRKALLDYYFSKGALTPPTIYVGFSSTTPTSAGGNVSEPAEASYARQATTAADWNVGVAGDPAVLDNATDITFPVATEDWALGAPLTHGVLFDAATGGNVVGFGTLATPKTILADDQISIRAGDLDVTLAGA